MDLKFWETDMKIKNGRITITSIQYLKDSIDQIKVDARKWNEQDEIDADTCPVCKTYDEWFRTTRVYDEYNVSHERACKVCGYVEKGD